MSKRNTKSGNILERSVISTFEGHGFEVVSYSEWKRKPEKYSNELLLLNYPYITIYKEKGRTEFLAISERLNFKIRIECKWQQVSGSVDEKFPYLYLNAIEAIPEDDFIIIIGGDGFKKGAIEWLREAVSKKKYANANSKKRNIKVFSLTDFMAWANKTLRS